MGRFNVICEHDDNQVGPMREWSDDTEYGYFYSFLDEFNLFLFFSNDDVKTANVKMDTLLWRMNWKNYDLSEAKKKKKKKIPLAPSSVLFLLI